MIADYNYTHTHTHTHTHTKIYIYICIYIYMYIVIVIVCDHEITHISYAICRDKFLAFLHQQEFTKLYWTITVMSGPIHGFQVKRIIE